MGDVGDPELESVADALVNLSKGDWNPLRRQPLDSVKLVVFPPMQHLLPWGTLHGGDFGSVLAVVDNTEQHADTRHPPSHAAPGPMRVRRERKLPAILTSGDFVCEEDAASIPTPDPTAPHRSAKKHRPPALLMHISRGSHDGHARAAEFFQQDARLPPSVAACRYHPQHCDGQLITSLLPAPAMNGAASVSKRKQRTPSPSPVCSSQPLVLLTPECSKRAASPLKVTGAVCGCLNCLQRTTRAAINAGNSGWVLQLGTPAQ
jgi:hypothetical protein